MPDAIPTPFDIVEVPYVPWSPGLREWIAAFVVFLVLFAATWIVSRRKARSRSKIIWLLLQEIERAANKGGAADIERLVHLSRRVLEHITGRDVSTLSPSELGRAAKEDGSQNVANALRELAALEGEMYAPPSAEHHESMRSAARRLSASLKEFVTTSRTR
jgi:hypothetical protein